MVRIRHVGGILATEDSASFFLRVKAIQRVRQRSKH